MNTRYEQKVKLKKITDIPIYNIFNQPGKFRTGHFPPQMEGKSYTIGEIPGFPLNCVTDIKF